MVITQKYLCRVCFYLCHVVANVPFSAPLPNVESDGDSADDAHSAAIGASGSHFHRNGPDGWWPGPQQTTHTQLR